MEIVYRTPVENVKVGFTIRHEGTDFLVTERTEEGWFSVTLILDTDYSVTLRRGTLVEVLSDN